MGSWVSTAIAVARSIPPSSAKAASGHAATTRSASGKRAGWAKRARGSTTNGRQPTARAILHSWAAKSTAPKTNSRGGGNVHVDEQRRAVGLAALGALGPHQLVGGRGRRGVELGGAERPLPGPVGRDEQLGAGIGAREHGDEGGAEIRARRVGEGGLRPAHDS